MNAVQQFFIFCSGSNEAILKRTPTDLNKHVGIGATIFFTGIFAALAGAYAIYTVFESYLISILVGLIWGAMIFNLDRYIVSSLKMKRSIFRNFMGAFPRIILATIIAIVIAKPLELKIFNSEIQSELTLMQQENTIEQEQLLRTRFEKDISQTQLDLSNLKREIADQELKRDELDAIAIAEADGTGGSLKRNMGPIYRAKKEDALKAENELIQVKSTNLPLITDSQNKLNLLNEKMSTELNQLKEVQLTGFAARLEALDRLTNKSQAMLIANIFIMLLFIAIETTPIFVKLISSRSPYDFVLDKHEHVFSMNHQLNTTLLSNEIRNKVSFDTELGSYKTNVAMNTEKRIIKEVFEENYQDIKSGKKTWKNLFGRSSIFDF